MKKIRKMVSVVLCVVISCMCFATPACAAEGEGVAAPASNIREYGIEQVLAYPAIVNVDTGEIEELFTPAKTQYYSGGAFLVNLTIDPVIKAIFEENNCNYWVYVIRYNSDSGVTAIDYNIKNKELTGTLSSTSAGSFSFFVPNTDKYDYVNYELVWWWRDGTNFVSGGHISR